MAADKPDKPAPIITTWCLGIQEKKEIASQHYAMAVNVKQRYGKNVADETKAINRQTIRQKALPL